MSVIPSYGKIHALGHPNVRNVRVGWVVVQEKIDGSQFSAQVRGGVLHVRSKGQAIYLPSDNKLFDQACATFTRLHGEGKLREGWIYRGESMMGPRHNVLTYERQPVGGIILWDIEKGAYEFTSSWEMEKYGSDLGLECVPTFYEGSGEDLIPGLIPQWAGGTSILGGPMEGVVVKNRQLYGMDGKPLMGKFVRDEFKEVHRGRWKADNPGKGDQIENIISALRTEARWDKALQNLRERGIDTLRPECISEALKQVQCDVYEEEREQIKDALWTAFGKDILRGTTHGLPEYIKEIIANGT